MKAFKVTLPDYFPTLVSIYAALTASKARYHVWYFMKREANYTSIHFSEINVKRAPEFDSLAKSCGKIEQLGWHDNFEKHGCFEVGK
jgi:hypothetical protein